MPHRLWRNLGPPAPALLSTFCSSSSGPREMCPHDPGRNPRPWPYQCYQQCAADVSVGGGRRLESNLCSSGSLELTASVQGPCHPPCGGKATWYPTQCPFFVFLLRPLHIAARNGLASVVQALLSRGATVLAVDEEGGWGPGIPASPGWVGSRDPRLSWVPVLVFCVSQARVK